MNHLKNIGVALHKYHEAHKSFPPSWIVDDAGHRAHGQRALLLPFVDQRDLHDRYRFDEPWDGPHNRRLHKTSVPVYRCPSDQRKRALISYPAVVGPDAAWRGSQPLHRTEMTDGGENLVMLIEARRPEARWMQPVELNVGQVSAAAERPRDGSSRSVLASRHQGGTNVLFADGAARILFFPKAAAVFRKRLTIADGAAQDTE